VPIGNLFRDPIDVIGLHCAEPVWAEAQDVFVEVIFRGFARYPSPFGGYFARKILVFLGLRRIAVCKILIAIGLRLKYCI
jgi:hypothetical protein